MKKINYSEVTPEKIYNNRRFFIKSLGLGVSSIAMTALPLINNANLNLKNLSSELGIFLLEK